jgi:uncharacterized protein (TIGR02594 family)
MIDGAEVAQIASRFIGVHEAVGPSANNPFIVWALSLCGLEGATDEVPWCSAFVNAIAFMGGLQRTRSASARSWLAVGVPVPAPLAMPGDIVILKRGTGPQPGADVLNAPGHVGICIGPHNGDIQIVGGNQHDAVSIASFPAADILGVRRLRSV